ncbi:MAG: isopentenyl-diphosphate Delta-isomerase [Chitinophagaceae bacterium]|nr:isopentenyl-diphosphate Delta-isomerase [Chitinophagaceae bacterium]
MEEVILVDEQDNEIGLMEKIEAHEKAMLHRAFSVFIFNHLGEMLLHQRAYKKYHCGGLWTNACCSHPRFQESNINAATRRLKEEMGIVTPLEKIFHFTYKAIFDNGLTEYEYDHVFVGHYDGEINADVNEVETHVWKNIEEIAASTISQSQIYTPWFLVAFPKVHAWYKAKQLAN